MIDMKGLESLTEEERKFLYLAAVSGNGEIPHFDENDIPALRDNEASELLWLPVNRLYMRSDRLRPKGQPALVSTPEHPLGIPTETPTVSIHDIAKTYRQHDFLNSDPILCHLEQVPDLARVELLVYEGRHRAVAAAMVERPFILGRLIGPEYSSVISQHSTENTKYYNKPIFSLPQLIEKYRNNPTV